MLKVNTYISIAFGLDTFARLKVTLLDVKATPLLQLSFECLKII